ncbi:MAG: hypothetical protein SFW64_08100 [Alphaproteobacteria bacterium]|nr:hypothetical protein [Alphaproteobacteria bacterium]
MLTRPLLLLLALSFTPAAHAGAWLQPEGQGLFIANATYYRSDRFFDSAGHKQPQPRFAKYEFQPYGEYGVTRWLTLGGSAYLQHVTQSGRANDGLADPEFFARTTLWQRGSERLAVQPLVKFAGGFRRAGTPRGGSRSTDAELSLLYGRNLDLLSRRDYLDSRVGYRVRSQGRSPEWRGDVALGLGIRDTVQIIPALRAVVASAPDKTPDFSENGDLDSSVLKMELAGIYHLEPHQWVQASLFRHVIGFQTGDGYGLSLAFAQRF